MARPFPCCSAWACASPWVSCKQRTFLATNSNYTPKRLYIQFACTLIDTKNIRIAQQLQSSSNVALHLQYLCFDCRTVTVLSILDEWSWFESYDHLILFCVSRSAQVVALLIANLKKIMVMLKDSLQFSPHLQHQKRGYSRTTYCRLSRVHSGHEQRLHL